MLVFETGHTIASACIDESEATENYLARLEVVSLKEQ